jgi:hypothetical protein
MIPATFRNAITKTIRSAGEAITYTPVTETGDAGTPLSLRASVQSPAEAGLIADADQEMLVVFISTDDLEDQPTKFDRIYARGRERSLIADAQGIGADDSIFAWQCMVTG